MNTTLVTVESSLVNTSFLFCKDGYCYHAEGPMFSRYLGRHVSEVQFAMSRIPTAVVRTSKIG